MKPMVLLVDDEINILEAYRRNLRDQFELVTANSGQEALDALKTGTPPTVIITDYKMPGMNGVELLAKFRELSPDTVQIMLTGQAEMQAVIELINKGKIFRFLTKPCSTEDLSSNILDAARQYELVTSERELLGKTLGGSIRVLTDLLALAKPQAFHRAQRIRSFAAKIVSELRPKNGWQIEIAAMLSQIGCVTIPDEILKKAYGGKRLADFENFMFKNHPAVAADMVVNIPRLEKVADIIRYQERRFDGSGFPEDGPAGGDLPLGARIIHIALEYDRLVNSGMYPDAAAEEMRKNANYFDPEVLGTALKVFKEVETKKKRYVTSEFAIDQLRVGMYLADDLVSASGVILGSKNQKINSTLLLTLQNYEKNKQIKGPIRAITPAV